MATQTAIDMLIDKQTITELIYRLARSIDRCDAALLQSLFHPDATDDHGSFQGTAADFVPWVMGVLGTMNRTQHMIGNMLIDIDGDSAASETYFVAHHVIPRDDGEVLMIAAGRYLDRFERRDGAWKFSHRHAVYDWSSTAPASDIWNRADPGVTVFGTRGGDDASYANQPTRRHAPALQHAH